MRTFDDLCKKRIWINDLGSNFYSPPKGPSHFYHYTSLPVLFSILEKDAIWVSGTRFSNDSSEEILLNNDAFYDMNYRGDSFILCFSDKEDCLSQWRGYCFNGGAAIEFDIGRPRFYSVLHADNETSHKYELQYNVPFPVIYVDAELLSRSTTTLSDQILSDSTSKKYSPWEARDIIPYLKDRAFGEESEWRLMFSNHKGELSKCVRFRTMHDGAKVPYMIVKAGDQGQNLSGCAFDIDMYTKEEFAHLRDNGIDCITIPQGNDQESVYYKLESLVRMHNIEQKGKAPIKIYCEGHLPIKRIIVAPTYDRDRVAEKIKRYCWSNYWLRNVEVIFSSIPYIPPSE